VSEPRAVPPEVAVDTGVYSSLLRPGHPLAIRYARYLHGPLLYVAAQTVGEVRYGALVAQWGKRRVARMEALVATCPVIVADDLVASKYAELRAECRRIGHALHDKVHVADAWVAASAIAYELPLVADDAVFEDAPGLDLIRHPA
jgi:predicted nucleic acid-binding protein